MFLQGWTPPPVPDLALLMMVGLLGGLAQYLMTLSYQHLALGIISPLKYLSIVFSGIIAYLVWGEIPDLQSLCGIALIIATGLYTLHRELLRAASSAAALEPLPEPIAKAKAKAKARVRP